MHDRAAGRAEASRRGPTGNVQPHAPKRLHSVRCIHSVPTKGNRPRRGPMARASRIRRCRRSPPGPTSPRRPSSAADNWRADYRLRIFTPGREMTFAGHSDARQLRRLADLGRQSRSRAWSGRTAASASSHRCERRGRVCRAENNGGAAAGRKSATAITAALGLASDRHRANRAARHRPRSGRCWELKSAADVLAVGLLQDPLSGVYSVGLIGAHPPGSECQFETRMLAPSSGMSEDRSPAR